MASTSSSLASFSASLPPYLALASSNPITSFQTVVDRSQTLWNSLEECEAAVVAGGERVKALREALLAGLKDAVLEIAAREHGEGEENAALYSSIRDILDLSLALHTFGKLDARSPYIVLEEALSSLEIEGCEAVFGFLESRFDELKLPLSKELENSAGLGLIRACNTLLGRLSKADDAALRGRILNFMASAFSLSARGGVNLRGEFNVGNVTDFEIPVEDEDEEVAMEGVVMEDKSEPEDEKEEGEEEEEDKKETDVVDLKESFYVTFWSLQAAFSNPSLLSTSSSKPSRSNLSTPASTPVPGAKDTNEPSSYKLFLARLDAVLKTFQKRTDRERVLRGAGDGSLKRPREGEEEGEGLGEGYMPKFLTNPQLLDYELSDVSFRRQVLIQAIILLGFLRSAPSSKPVPKIFKARMTDFEVDPSVEGELTTMWRRAFEELDATVPGGSKFSNSLLNVMRREANWASWKDVACPPFDLPPLDPSKLVSIAAKRRRLNEVPLVARIQHQLGTPALSELWEEHEVYALEQLENPRPLDDLKSYASRIKKQDLQLDQRRKALEKAGVSEQSDDKVQSLQERKSSLTFRALRQASRTSLDLFSYIKPQVPTKGHPHNYVEMILDAGVKSKEKAAQEKLEKEKVAAGGPSLKVVPVVEVEVSKETASASTSAVPPTTNPSIEVTGVSTEEPSAALVEQEQSVEVAPPSPSSDALPAPTTPSAEPAGAEVEASKGEEEEIVEPPVDQPGSAVSESVEMS